MDKYLKMRLSSILDCKEDEITVVKKLDDGMTNESFLCKCQNELYVFRQRGKYNFYSLEEEYNNLVSLKDTNITNELIDFDLIKGEKVSKYIEGMTIVSDPLKYIDETAFLLKKIHNLKINTKVFSLDLNEYEKLNINYTFPLKYQIIKDKYYEIVDNVNIVQNTFCHNDFQPGNLIMSDHLYVIDFETAGLNDPFYDIASFGSFRNFNNSILLLEKYLNRTPTNKELIKLYSLRIFQILRWFNIAIYKSNNDSKKTNDFDFITIANSMLEIGEVLIKECQKIER